MNSPRPPSKYLLLREIPQIPKIWTGRWRKPKAIAGLVEPDHPPAPVIVIPGLMSRDNSTSLLRRTLKLHGYPAYASKMGFMRGITLGRMRRAEQRLQQIADRHQGPVVLVGWSLGGLYARVLARRHPHLVKMVMTLGTPFSGSRKANNAWRVYDFLNDHTVDTPPIVDDPSIKPEAHTVALWSRIDGVIAPDCARGQPSERDAGHEIAARHMEFACDHKAVDQVVSVLVRQLKQIE